MRANNVETASKVVKRQARYEWELDHMVLESVFSAGSPDQLRALVQTTVFDDNRYTRLPKYRQVALEAYFRGAMDALARVATAPGLVAPAIAAASLRTAPARQRKVSVKRTVPPLYDATAGLKTPIPGWMIPTSKRSAPPPIGPSLTSLYEISTSP